MPESSSFLQLALGRAEGALRRLQGSLWLPSDNGLAITSTQPQLKHLSLAEAKKQERQEVTLPFHWGCLFEQCWRRVTFERSTTGQDWLHWMDQGEATLYLHEQPYFGFNVAHRRCRLPPGLQEAWVQSSCIQSAIWHPEATGIKHGSHFEKAHLAQRHDPTWEAYHDLKCLLDLALDLRPRQTQQTRRPHGGAGLKPALESVSPEYRLLLKALELAVDAYDTQGIDAMRSTLAEAYGRLRLDKAFARAVLTGHAHVDLVWLWPERVGELKAVNALATAAYLIDEYPEYRFAYSQPASYEAVARREPGLYRRIQEKITTGHWQATGAMYVESDTLIACGEALARSFTLGQEAFTQINGQPSQLTWLPDVFGYSACLPQIMQQTGVDYFFTTKMTWNAINRFPHSSFLWRGHDGSEVLAHVTQDSGYVTQMEIGHVKAPMEANMQAELHPEFLLPTGYGDGGGGATDDMLERARRLGQLPSMPAIGWDHPEAFFERLATVSDKLPVHEGECYLEYHRGTYTTHANLKAIFRQLERALQVSEAVSCATGKTWDREHAWKRLVFAQFHDYIPGSSVWDVYLEGLPELAKLAEAEEQKAAEALSDEGETCLFNPHALPIEYWHESSDGKRELLSLPPLGGTPVSEAKRVALKEPVRLDGYTACNGLVQFSLNEDGWIDQLNWHGKEVPIREPLAQLWLYPDRAANFDAWDIDSHVLPLGEACRHPASIHGFQEGDYQGGFRVTRPVGQRSSATVVFTLQQNSPLLHLAVELDWQEEESLLKLHFPTGYTGKDARFGIPFGSVLRPQKHSSQQAEAMWEVPFSRYLAVFDDGERNGMHLVTKDKYGANVREGNIGLSLVRSPKVTGFCAGHARNWPSHLSQYGQAPAHSDLGNHRIELAIGSYRLDLPREEQPAARAETLFTPPVAYTGKSVVPLFESLRGGDTLVPVWAQPAKDDKGWTLRLHEVAGQRGQVDLQLPPGTTASLTNLGTTNATPLANSSALNFVPYQLLSLKLQPASSETV